jgi:UDP-4-amino-4-deoxy-L-arabinose formyltransferase/UDP-glucuronic acid dehydrogenase (UDP-4-keto-hexauronic acid decarboxylating)
MNEPINLVDGGMQKRCFTYIEDGIDCLMKIIENKNGLCSGEIFNIGNPNNECSMRELAEGLLDLYKDHLETECYGINSTEIIEVSSDEYYGEGYQDISSRKPSIKKAQELLGWEPVVDLGSALKKTLDFFIEESRVKGLLCT